MQTSTPPPEREAGPSFAEFVILLAAMVSIVAMATDMMLPGLGLIASDLALVDPNDAHLIVSVLFAGFAIGQFFVGPISDSVGRKPVIYGGYCVFIAGCLLSILARDMDDMLLGRFLQGLGAAAPRVVTVALVRDRFEGRAMARVMSIIMGVFILVPMAAPAIGQGIIVLGGWRATFGFLAVVSIATGVWFALRQPETLLFKSRRRFSLGNIAHGVVQAFSIRQTAGYAIATGFIFGSFLGYLSSAQQVFAVVFDAADEFPAMFAIGAAAFGVATFSNARLVMRLGMRRLTRTALLGAAICAVVFLAVLTQFAGAPPLWVFMIWLCMNSFCMGFLFGNLNALAMAPLGHLAGLGAALVGGVSTFMSIPFGWAVGAAFDGTVTPLVCGFGAASLLAFLTMAWTERSFRPTEA